MKVTDQGIITHLYEEENVTSQAGTVYAKRMFVIQVDDKDGYKRDVRFTAINDNVSDLKNAKVGDTVEVTYKPTSRYSDKFRKWFDEHRLLSITVLSSSKPEAPEEDMPDFDDSGLPF